MGIQHTIQRIVVCGAVGALFLTLSASNPTAFAQDGLSYDEQYDLTGNAVIDGGDTSVVMSGWGGLQDANPCVLGALAAADVNGDGCVDVADVQRVAERVGSVRQDRLRIGPRQSNTPLVWTVTSSDDDADEAPGNGVCRSSNGKCTLRAAISEANMSVAPDRIEFNIRNANGSCPSIVNIYPDSFTRGALTLDDPNGYGTTIDGYTQCDARPNTEDVHGNAVIKIDLRGRLERDVHGIRLLSANNVVRGLAIFSWDRQIEIFGGKARYNHIEGNFIGTNAAQTFTSPGLGTHHSEGLRIQVAAHRNVIGCGSFDTNDNFVPCDQASANAARNLIVGNGNDGIHFQLDVTHNHIVGNYIGVKQDGITRLKNNADGVDMEIEPQYNWLGGLTPPERNVISGNGSEGIEISHSTRTKFNSVAGNYFGLDATGTKAVPNNGNGISFEDTVDQNYAFNNYVSGNLLNGFRFYVMVTRNEVRNNIVGLTVDGRPMPNLDANGLFGMGGSSYNIITGNVFANHRDAGVSLTNSSDAAHNGFGTTYYNTISKNTMYNNGREGIVLSERRRIYANENLAAPTLLAANTRLVRGKACSNCKVEVFIADKTQLTAGGIDESGEGKTFIGEGMTDATGAFLFNISEVPLGTILTTTATDSKGNTSRFGKNIAVTDVFIEEPTPLPTLSPTPGTPEATGTPDTNGTPEPSQTPTGSETPGPTATATSQSGTTQNPAIWLPVVIKGE